MGGRNIFKRLHARVKKDLIRCKFFFALLKQALLQKRAVWPMWPVPCPKLSTNWAAM